MPPKKPNKPDVRTKQSASGVNRIEVKTPEGISFSFRYFQDDNDKFSVRVRESNYFQSLLVRMRNLSTLTFQEMLANRSQSLRCHKIVWSDTSEPNGFGIPNEEKLVETPYQFQISANEYGRVHGFFVDNVFYIVWLDPDHNLYS